MHKGGAYDASTGAVASTAHLHILGVEIGFERGKG